MKHHLTRQERIRINELSKIRRDHSTAISFVLEPMCKLFRSSNSKLQRHRTEHVQSAIRQEKIDLAKLSIDELRNQVARLLFGSYTNDEGKALERRCAAVASGILIAVDREVKEARRYAEAVFEADGLPKYQRLKELGPKVGKATWAEGIVAAANYVRHKDEWRELYMDESLRAAKENREATEDFSTLLKGYGHNVKTLEAMEVSQYEIFSDLQDVSIELVHKLECGKSVRISELLEAYINEVEGAIVASAKPPE